MSGLVYIILSDAKVHLLYNKGCDNFALCVTILKVSGHLGVTIFKIVTPQRRYFELFSYFCRRYGYTPHDAIHGSGADAAAHDKAALPARKAH